MAVIKYCFGSIPYPNARLRLGFLRLPYSLTCWQNMSLTMHKGTQSAFLPQSAPLLTYAERRLRPLTVNSVLSLRFCAPQSENAFAVGSHCLYVHGFRFFFTAGGSFRLSSRYWFTIGQSEYLAWRMAPIFRHYDTTCLAPYYRAHSMRFCVRGCYPCGRAPFQTLPLTHAIRASLSPVRSPPLGNLG